MKTETIGAMRERTKKLFEITAEDVTAIEANARRNEIIALAAFKKGQSYPKIKQLEWMEYENLRGRKSYFAKTPFSPYEVADGGDHFTMFSPNKRLRFASAGEAKAASQADFERRVKECLDL
jgi:hypothetical protein